MGFKSDFLLWFIVIFLFALLLNLVKQFIKSLNQSSIEVEKNKCGVDCPIFSDEKDIRDKNGRGACSPHARARSERYEVLSLSYVMICKWSILLILCLHSLST